MLALISESYFKFRDRDWNYDGQRENAHRKGLELLQRGCLFSEFGTRRRRDSRTQDLVLQGLIDASKELGSSAGKLTGTSNVHFAMRYGLMPIGTVAHEWFMGIAAATNSYRTATEAALQCWLDCFGPGILGIALTDTFGTNAFLKAFSKPAGKGDSKTYAQLFKGVRQDSGDPKTFIDMMREYYDGQGIGSAAIVFSDSLNIDLCLEYKQIAEEQNFQPSFGIGTFLTSK